MKKEDIIAELSRLGIEHDPDAKKDELQALLPKNDRQVRWDAYVENYVAESPKGKAKQANGEFDEIPASFV